MSKKLTPKEKAKREKARNIARRRKFLRTFADDDASKFSVGIRAAWRLSRDPLMRNFDLIPPQILKLKPLIDRIATALKKYDEAERKLAEKQKRERWRKDHPQWRIADLDRLLTFPINDDAATFERYHAAWRAHDMWCFDGTPMTEAVLGPPTHKAEVTT